MSILSSVMEWVIGIPLALVLWMALYTWGRHIHEAQVRSQPTKTPSSYKTSTGGGDTVAIVTPTRKETTQMEPLTHQQLTDELVAQIEEWDAENGTTPIIEFHLDEGEQGKKELVLSDVRFEDGVIQAKLTVF